MSLLITSFNFTNFSHIPIYKPQQCLSRELYPYNWTIENVPPGLNATSQVKSGQIQYFHNVKVDSVLPYPHLNENINGHGGIKYGLTSVLKYCQTKRKESLGY